MKTVRLRRKKKIHEGRQKKRKWIGKINNVEMSILHKTMYRFSVISIKISVVFSDRNREKNSKICMKP